MDKKLLQIISELISFQTVEGYDQQKSECVDYSESILTSADLFITKQTFSGMPCIYASTQNTKSPKILLQAHLDVVPGQPEVFHLRTKGKKLTGRGVFDMKFAAACFLQLAQELSDKNKDYDYGIMLTTDEEIGGENGVAKLLEEGIRADVCILPDGGDDWQIESEANGLWIVRLRATGKSSHGSRPWEGDNAIDRVMEGVEAISGVFTSNHPDNCSLVVTQISGGTAVNQVPNYAEVTLDMRFLNDEHFKIKQSKIEKIIKKQALALDVIAEVPACRTDFSHPLIRSFINTTEETLGIKVGKTRSHGSSDARYFQAAGIPTILIRPPGGGHHGDEEWIDSKGLQQFYEVIKAYVTREAKIA